MTTGEFEFDSIFRQSPNGDSDGAEEIPFANVSYILWILFIVVMPILLTNMLVGLAVGDIDRIQKAASLKKLALQVNLVLAVEKTLRSRPFNTIHSIAWKKIYPNSKITSMPMSDVSELSEKSQQWKKFLSHLKFEVWGGERYDSLKSITESLSRLQHDNTDLFDSSENTVSAAGLEKILKQNAELVVEVKKSQEELQELLTKIAEKILFTTTAPSTPVALTAPSPTTSAV